MKGGIFISYRRDDAPASAADLYGRLTAYFGTDRVFRDVDLMSPASDFADAIEHAIGSSGVMLVVIGKDWLATSKEGKRRLDDPGDSVRREIATALQRRIRVVPVLVEGATMPRAHELPTELAALARRQAVELDARRWDATSDELIQSIVLYYDPPRPAQWSRTIDLTARVAEAFRSLWRTRPTRDRAEGSHDADADAATGSSPGRSSIEPVSIGASAPRHLRPGQAFTAVLVIYVDAARESARKALDALGEAGDRVVMDIPPQRNACWQRGAPVAVRLAGHGVDVTPAEVRFEWNGRQNVAAFSVRVREDAPSSLSLCFEVFLAEVPIAFLPLGVTVGAEPATVSVERAGAIAPGTAFASYASKDAESVTQRLSTLQRWSPHLDIFQDCLDLRPDSAFEPQIKAQISRRDVFLLFWSRNAAASRWVRWEYRTARDTRGLDAILPMPLEDPAIAPPPAELADRHLRDRFMLAGYALATIRDETMRHRPRTQHDPSA